MIPQIMGGQRSKIFGLSSAYEFAPPPAGNPAVYPAGKPLSRKQLPKILLAGTYAKAKYNEKLVQKAGL